MNFEAIALSATASVPIPGMSEPALVRGLSLADILGLVAKHKAAMSQAFAELNGDTDKILTSAGAIGSGLLEAMPEVAADVIAIAGDAPEKAALAAKFPASVQLALLEKIAELTFAAEGGAGKVVEIVLNAVGGTAGLVKKLGQRP